MSEGVEKTLGIRKELKRMHWCSSVPNCVKQKEEKKEKKIVRNENENNVDDDDHDEAIVFP